ncbi:MAG: sulfatase [Tunicatimonas sp.]|uniref:sulfatase n=1 Tax=Tunicatimonas sp. TaxID=1940096 RepID=UPI003C78CEF1
MEKPIINFWFLALIVFCFAIGCQPINQSDESPPLNVLFITIDDLRPQLGCYGDPIVQSPHIDHLASQGLLFNRAYCQQALCAPSRSSFLTGRRPATTGVYDIETSVRDALPDVVTLPQLFKNNGYESLGLFKVFHLVGFDPNGFGSLNDTVSWTRPLWLPTRSSYGPYGDSILRASKQACLEQGPLGYGNIPRSLAYEAPTVADSMLNDGQVAQQAIRYLQSSQDEPFFLAVGFYHPHLPFTAPKKYWDQYDRKQLRLPENQYLPEGAPSYAVADNKELRSYIDIPDTAPFSDSLKQKLLHGYLAAISYVDAQVGLILKELDRLNLRENTIVVLMGDHGYQIGEHGMWAKKHTNFEMATRVPLIISAPGQTAQGQTTMALTELVDIYPTLAELAGLTSDELLEGSSLVPLLNDPDQDWKTAAFSSYPRGGRMGNSMRTDRYRLTAWTTEGKDTEYELYDHRHDPQENQNVVNQPDYLTVRDSLNQALEQGWSAATPR